MFSQFQFSAFHEQQTYCDYNNLSRAKQPSHPFCARNPRFLFELSRARTLQYYLRIRRMHFGRIQITIQAIKNQRRGGSKLFPVQKQTERVAGFSVGG